MKATREFSGFFSGKKQKNISSPPPFSALNNSVCILSSLDEFIALQDSFIIGEIGAYHSHKFLQEQPASPPCLLHKPYLIYLTQLLNENQRNKYLIMKELIAILAQYSTPLMTTPTRNILGSVVLGMCINMEKLQPICEAFSFPLMMEKPEESLTIAWKNLLQMYAIPEEKYKDLFNSLINKFHYGFYLHKKSFQVLNQSNKNSDIIAIDWSLFESICTKINIDTKNAVFMQFVDEIKREAYGSIDHYVCVQDLLHALEKRKLTSGQYKNISHIFSEETMHAVDFEKIYTLLLETFTDQNSPPGMQHN